MHDCIFACNKAHFIRSYQIEVIRIAVVLHREELEQQVEDHHQTEAAEHIGTFPIRGVGDLGCPDGEQNPEARRSQN